MIEKTVQVTVVETTITDIGGARELQDWCEKQPGLYCRITAKADGGWNVEVGGATADEKPVEFGDTVKWDGTQFTVLTEDGLEREQNVARSVRARRPIPPRGGVGTPGF